VFKRISRVFSSAKGLEVFVDTKCDETVSLGIEIGQSSEAAMKRMVGILATIGVVKPLENEA